MKSGVRLVDNRGGKLQKAHIMHACFRNIKMPERKHNKKG
jgi:hypothetical protein